MRRFLKFPILIGMLGLAPVLAHAHAKPKVMVPEANSTVSAPPQVSIVFSEALEPKFSSLKLTDANSAVVSKAASVVDPADPKHMTLELPKLSPGVYYVHWVTAATDGHRMDGEYSFTVK
jgi:methionine-rich copper-binding protein CopC